MLLDIASSTDRQLSRLVAFGQAAYDLLGNGRDALFDLMDANLATRSISSLAELSLSPVFRRGWPSTYDAVEDGWVPGKELMQLYCVQLPAERVLLAGDHTAWSRTQARTLRDRTIEHQPTPVPGNRPITIGQGYSTLAYVPERQGSWALPLLHERIASDQTPIQKAADQLKEACKGLARQIAAEDGLEPPPEEGPLTLPAERRPIALYDAEYGNAKFVLASAGIPADKVMRLRPNMNLWGPPPPYSGKGRPREHGEKLKLSDANTWGPPAQAMVLEDPKLGNVRVQMWKQLHFRKAKAHTVTAVCIERVNAKGTRRDPKVLWLAWVSEEGLSLADHWRDYLRRFAVDHWYRFAKGRLHWTLPQLATPERSQTWSDLMPLMTWQLWLARPVLEDNPLPWQKAQACLTPGRTCQAWAPVLVHIGTPARVPKPRGNSPGWPKGRARQPRPVYPVVKKTQEAPKKAAAAGS